MEALFGFITLTSPLFLVVLWLPVCIALAVWVSRKFKKTSLLLKVVIGSLTFLSSLILPFADEIVGRIYFNHLCQTEAGVKIYQVVELPAEYWDNTGKALFYEGASNNDIPPNAFARLGIDINSKPTARQRVFQIEQFGSMISLKDSEQRLSEVIGFRYWGGWVAREMTSNNLATSCGGANSYDELVTKQFMPEKLAEGGDL
ncbi:hypothetical protein SAMN05660420_03396 [Desulfuromusa kysingii]|uniref:Uncharacterized protein n=1 Tax=Desulfuromusa kysingii TaxID=37625 RepID=A0A1H4EI95_9BACT|nr:hypothetical protein [Desulfuromusa kysingii]SEA84743.1 hypothetical protein SAMN05660420_03396 [Desulfuromusa kysingii]